MEPRPSPAPQHHLATEVPYVTILVDDEELIAGKWKVGLFSCFHDFLPNCLCSCCCSCVTFGQIISRLGIADFFLAVVVYCLATFTGFQIAIWLGLFYLRYKFRLKFNIPGSCCGDCCATCCCQCCVLAQMATHIGSYTPGKCDIDPKATLPGFSNILNDSVPITIQPQRVCHTQV